MEVWYPCCGSAGACPPTSPSSSRWWVHTHVTVNPHSAHAPCGLVHTRTVTRRSACLQCKYPHPQCFASASPHQILMVLADHGPAVSGAHNTIVTARAGKDLVSSVVAGLLTVGPRFGGALDGASGVGGEKQSCAAPSSHPSPHAYPAAHLHARLSSLPYSLSMLTLPWVLSVCVHQSRRSCSRRLWTRAQTLLTL